MSIQGLCAGALAAGVIGLCAGALAADLPAKAPPIAPYDWTGFYAGVNAGYGDIRGAAVTQNDNAPTLINILAAERRFSFAPRSGFVGGVQAGYNWQMAPTWVMGVEADLSYLDGGRDTTSAFLFGGAFPGSFTASQQTKWIGTVRGRLGFLPTDRLLVYGTGGFAYGRIETSGSVNNNFGANLLLGAPICAAQSTCYQGSESKTATGWTAGGGLEYAAWRNVTLRLEYLYVELGGETLALSPSATTTGGGSATFKFSSTAFNVVRGGVSFKF